MGLIPVANPLPPRRLRFGRREIAIGLAAAAVFAAFVVAIVFALPTGRKVDSARWVTLRSLDQLTVNKPVVVPNHNVYLVRLENDEVLALWRRDPHLGCTVPWRPAFEFMGRKGWFRNPCFGETYDLEGHCVAGSCLRGLDRFPVMIRDDRVQVDLQTIIPGEPVELQGSR